MLEVVVGITQIPGWIWAIIGLVLLPPLTYILVKIMRKGKKRK